MKILFDGKYQSIMKNDKIYIIIKVLFYIKELFQEIELKILKIDRTRNRHRWIS